jgi:hypothetical protein
MLAPGRVSVAVWLYQVRPRQLTCRHAALCLSLAARAVATGTRQRRGRHVNLAHHSVDLWPGRARAALVDGLTALFLYCKRIGGRRRRLLRQNAVAFEQCEKAQDGESGARKEAAARTG